MQFTSTAEFDPCAVTIPGKTSPSYLTSTHAPTSGAHVVSSSCDGAGFSSGITDTGTSGPWPSSAVVSVPNSWH